MVFLSAAILAPLACGQITVPGTFRLDSSLADTSKPGFLWRVHQVGTPQPNSNDRTEEQLAGLLGENIAEPSAQGTALGPATPAVPSTVPLTFEIETVINLSVFGWEYNGNFWPDDQMPGIPNAWGNYENIAAEVLTWVELPAGTVTLGVNSDDGFRMTLGGANPVDRFALRVGEFNGGRGAADTLFSFEVAEAGLYAARCTWEQGCCGGNLEVFSVGPDGNRVLLNDRANGGIAAYRATTAPARAYARRVSPGPGQGIPAVAPVTIELVDGATPISLSSVQLLLDDAAVPATPMQADGVTTVSYNHTLPFTPGAHSASLVYMENGTTRTVNWEFTVLDYVGPNGNFYEFVPAGNMAWEDAKLAAEQRTFLCGVAGHLVTITSEEENVFVELLRQQYIQAGALPNGEVWAGGFQLLNQPGTSLGWFWVNNEGPIAAENAGNTFANWNVSTSEPNDCCGSSAWEDNEENYLGLGFYEGGVWIDDDVVHNNIVGYVVEYERPPVPIDVKPGSSSNPVYLDSPGKLPVAVLSAATFDATTIVPSTVRFGRTGWEAGPVSYSLSDVNGDQRKDLVCLFNVQDAGLLCGDVSTKLTATTSSGCRIQGMDVVQILGCPPYALSVVSMQDVNHVTDVYLKVTPILPGRTAPTLARNVVLESCDIFGKQRWNRTLQNVALTPATDGSSSVALQYQDIEHGQNVKARVQVKDSVSGATQVLTQEGRTVYRPDLALGNVTASAGVITHQLVNISAVVRELKGDLGATAKAYLKEGGVVLDVVNNVAIGAHEDAVVVFTTMFRSTGQHELAVQLGDVVPGDYNLSNNEVGLVVEVGQLPVQETSYVATYSHFEQHDHHVESNPYWISVYDNQWVNDLLREDLYIPVALQFPIGRVQLDLIADGIGRAMVDVFDIASQYSYDDGYYSQESAWLDLEDNISLEITTSRDFSGNEQTWAYVSRYVYEMVYYSEYHDLIYGTSYTYSGGDRFGTPWNVQTSLQSWFAIEGDAGAFGGNGDFGVLNVSPFENTWDYYYSVFEPDDTRMTGFSRGVYVWSVNVGLTTP